MGRARVGGLAAGLFGLTTCACHFAPECSLQLTCIRQHASLRLMRPPVCSVLQKPFTFQPPTSIQQVGSFALGAATRARAPSLDLAVEMPAACFDSKDQLNHR